MSRVNTEEEAITDLLSWFKIQLSVLMVDFCLAKLIIMDNALDYLIAIRW